MGPEIEMIVSIRNFPEDASSTIVITRTKKVHEVLNNQGEWVEIDPGVSLAEDQKLKISSKITTDH